MNSYLALGDSYTIGELVAYADNFPNATVRLLRADGVEMTDPVIIATTGWTTDELAAAIRERNLTETFTVVSLLIGVNNQYRGRDVVNYAGEFDALLRQAIGFANGRQDHVFVLSIPDWGATPFAEGKDRAQIATEIDAYNNTCRNIAEQAGCHYLEITESTRRNGMDPEYLASDALHPSGSEYKLWAEQLAPMMKPYLQ